MKARGPIPLSRIYQAADEVITYINEGDKVLIAHQGVVIGQLVAFDHSDQLTKDEAEELEMLMSILEMNPDISPDEFCEFAANEQQKIIDSRQVS